MFIETYFLALIIFSVFLPVSIYIYMMWKKAISRTTVAALAVILIVISGIDVVLLQHLIGTAKTSTSPIASMFFAHEFAVALYLLPLLFAGVGVNMISHILITHLVEAEKQFNRQHR